MKTMIVLIMAVCVVGPVTGLCQDKPTASTQPPPSQLDRFIDGFSPEALVTNVAVDMSQMVRQERRQEAIGAFIREVDIDEVEQTLKKVFGRECTAVELKALADLCSAPGGRTALMKYVKCMEDAMSQLQPEFAKAYRKVTAPPVK